MRWRMDRWAHCVLVLLFCLIAGYDLQPAEAQVTITQITNTMRGAFVGNSDYPINADGTRIAFLSNANLTGGNPDGNHEIFLWTQGVGITQITNTTGGNNGYPFINSTGTRIAFNSSNNLTGTNPDGNQELFLWTQGVGIAQLTHTTGGNASWWHPVFTVDSTRIAFVSDRNLTGANPDGNSEIFLWTQGAGIAQITHTTGGDIGGLSMSAGGTRIAFPSTNDLTGGNLKNKWEIFFWTRGAGITQITNATWGYSHQPSINADGTRITFFSDANLTGDNPDKNWEIFLWTQGVGITQITSTTVTTSDRGSMVPSISADGMRIAFRSSGDFTGGNPNAHSNLFLWTQSRGISQITNAPPMDYYGSPSISGNGTRIAVALAADLTGDNPDGNAELFLATVGGTPPPPSGFPFGFPTTVPKYEPCDYESKTCAVKGKFHAGIDYSGNGTAVAVDRGTVVRIETMSSLDHGMGNNVIVSHVLPDGSTIFSTYSHLVSIDPDIAENRPVDKGQTLGVIGCSGFGDQYYWCRRGKIRNYHSPHLHFEMKTANGPVSGIPSTVTGNPKLVGKQYSTCERDARNAAANTCWGYVGDTLSPDQYGYVDPNRYLPR